MPDHPNPLFKMFILRGSNTYHSNDIIEDGTLASSFSSVFKSNSVPGLLHHVPFFGMILIQGTQQE